MSTFCLQASKFFASVGCSFAALALASSVSAAAEIKVLTAGAFKPVVLAVVPDFEKQTGHKVTVENDTVGGLSKRIASGEAFDLAVLSPAALEPLVKNGNSPTARRSDSPKSASVSRLNAARRCPTSARLQRFERR